MQLQVKARLAAAHILFIDYLLESKIGNASAAILLVRPHQQIALFARLGVRGAIYKTLLAPLFSMRRNLILEKTAHGIAEILMLGLKDQAAHSIEFLIARCSID